METASFNIPSISCNACSNKIKEGIWAVEYRSEDTQPQDIMKKISSMGFEVIPYLHK